MNGVDLANVGYLFYGTLLGLLGSVVFGTGVFLIFIRNQYYETSGGDLLLTLALISVFVAIFLLLIAYWATVITTVQNHRSVEFFGILMSAILTFEAYFMINGCIFIKDPNREQKIERFLNPMIKEYEYYGVFWDILQLEMECCGVKDDSSWNISSEFDINLPSSCCGVLRLQNFTCPRLYSLKRLGCAVAINNLLQSHSTEFWISCASLIIIQVVMIIFASLLYVEYKSAPNHFRVRKYNFYK